jgi:hypothetical protein
MTWRKVSSLPGLKLQPLDRSAPSQSLYRLCQPSSLTPTLTSLPTSSLGLPWRLFPMRFSNKKLCILMICPILPTCPAYRLCNLFCVNIYHIVLTGKISEGSSCGLSMYYLHIFLEGLRRATRKLTGQSASQLTSESSITCTNLEHYSCINLLSCHNLSQPSKFHYHNVM